jgi:hypothetical protein
MQIYLKISIGLFIVFGIGNIFLNEKGDDAVDALTTEQKKVVVEGKAEHNELPTSYSSEKNTRIQALKDEAQELYFEIVRLSGSSGKQKLEYEDNWCVASEDLSEQDSIYAINQMNEWKLTRGYVMPKGMLNDLVRGLNFPNDEFPGINDNYLDVYKEADKVTLLQLGERGDMLALNTLLRSSEKFGLNDDNRRKVAQELVTLGDTSFGLGRLVIDYIVNAEHAKRTEDGEPASYLKTSLVLVEFGLMRQDVSALETFLATTDDEKSLGGLNTVKSFTEEDFTDIRNSARLYFDEISKARITKGLRSFEEIDEPKIAQIHYAERLSLLHNEYGSVLDGTTFPISWKSNYLRKSPCVSRRIARHDFLTKKLPAIQDEIAMLQKDLN